MKSAQNLTQILTKNKLGFSNIFSKGWGVLKKLTWVGAKILGKTFPIF